MRTHRPLFLSMAVMAALALVLLAGCGGGGGDDEDEALRQLDLPECQKDPVRCK